MKIRTIEKISYKFMDVAKFFLKIALYVLIIFLIGRVLFNVGLNLFLEKPVDEKDTSYIAFDIKANDTVDDIAKNLKSKGLIEDEGIFKFRAKIYNTRIKPGTFNLSKSMSIKYILDVFDNAEVETTTKSQELETEEEIFSPENE